MTDLKAMEYPTLKVRNLFNAFFDWISYCVSGHSNDLRRNFWPNPHTSTNTIKTAVFFISKMHYCDFHQEVWIIISNFLQILCIFMLLWCSVIIFIDIVCNASSLSVAFVRNGISKGVDSFYNGIDSVFMCFLRRWKKTLLQKHSCKYLIGKQYNVIQLKFCFVVKNGDFFLLQCKHSRNTEWPWNM